jgi:pyruvate,water dikinase
MVMTYFGLLKKAYPEEILPTLIGFKSASGKQITALAALSKKITSILALQQCIDREDERGFFETLSLHPEIEKELTIYYETYGGRFANELKLESSDLKDDFKKFSQIINLYSHRELPKTIISVIKVPGSPLKRIFFRLILRKFKKYSTRREELRLLRSNSFAIVRKLFNQVGTILAEKKIIKERDDVFYLHVNEIFDYEDTETMPNREQVVEHRKKEYKSYEKITPLSYFSIRPEEQAPISRPSMNLKKIIQGQACTPGQIRGKVKIFKDFFVPDALDFDIVVSHHTVPGWAPLIGVTKGLIIEHGGVLSHAAIISRELGIPTVIGVQGILNTLKDGQIVELNGTTGTISLL